MSSFVSGCAPYPWEIWSAEERRQEVTPVAVSNPAGTRAAGIHHTVNRGETLWRIAKTYGIDLQVLAEMNDVDDPAKINVGDQIFIPGAKEVRQVVLDIRETASASSPRIITDSSTFIWPVRGKIISKYGVYNGLRYEGIEIAAPEGAPVCAASSGEVIYDGYLKGYGNIVIIKHHNNFKTVYAYNRSNLVPQGRKVSQGETIATVGKGLRTGQPCLHFQVWNGDVSRNPLFLLPKSY